MAENLVFKQCQLLVNTFVKNPNWPREIKIAKKILASYSLDTVLAVKRKNLYSLAYFLTEQGKSDIMRADKISQLDL